MTRTSNLIPAGNRGPKMDFRHATSDKFLSTEVSHQGDNQEKGLTSSDPSHCGES